jgi:hypothetical protein
MRKLPIIDINFTIHLFSHGQKCLDEHVCEARMRRNNDVKDFFKQYRVDKKTKGEKNKTQCAKESSKMTRFQRKMQVTTLLYVSIDV